MIPLFTRHVHTGSVYGAPILTDHVGKNHCSAMHLPTRPIDTGAWYTLTVFMGSSSSSSSSSSRDEYYLGGTIALLLQDHHTMSTTGSL